MSISVAHIGLLVNHWRILKFHRGLSERLAFWQLIYILNLLFYSRRDTTDFGKCRRGKGKRQTIMIVNYFYLDVSFVLWFEGIFISSVKINFSEIQRRIDWLIWRPPMVVEFTNFLAWPMTIDSHTSPPPISY